MVFDKEGTTTIVFQEDISLPVFLENLTKSYPKIKNDNLVINLFSSSELSSNDIMEFLQISNEHRGASKSFVLVTDKVAYDEVPEEICLVPTIQEAKDMIEMEEIERDLDL